MIGRRMRDWGWKGSAVGRTVLVLAGFFFVGAIPSLALACSDAPDPFNNFMVVRKDGSFKNADSEPGMWGRDSLRGDAVSDRGNGRVMQVVAQGSACFTIEYLVFVDCSSDEAIALWGHPPPPPGPDEGVIAGLIFFGVEFIQPPHGPINATGQDTVETLTEQASATGIRYSVRGGEDGDDFLWTHYPWNKGCKMFYPDSKGAKG
jgi:hypothetical protein